MLEHTQRLLDTVFTVDSLMTPRDKLLTYLHVGDESAIQRDEQPFDVIPVERGRRIVGVLEKGEPDIQPLSDRWLVTRDTSIPDLLELFVELKQKAFLVFFRRDVIGLVTPADLNKMPARAYMYNLIGELEIGLAGLIRTKYTNGVNGLLELLSDKRRKELLRTHSKLLKGNTDVDFVQSFYLTDLIEIIEKDAELYEQIGQTPDNKAEDIFSGLNLLRRHTMHLVKPLLSNLPDDLDTLHDRIGRIKGIMDQLKRGGVQ